MSEAVEPLIATSGFTGRVRRPGLLDVLDTCHHLGLSGLITVTAANGNKAEIHVERGRLRFAKLGDQQGTGALTRAILFEDAQFALAQPDERPPRNIQQETAFVLESIAKVLTDAGVQLSQTFRKAHAPAAPTVIPAATMAIRRKALEGPATERVERFNPPQVGESLGRCRIVAEFARGATSIVYLAWHETLKADVVIKVIQPGAGASPQGRLLTENEASILARLSHPAVMRIYDYVQDPKGWTWLVMEYVDGQSLNRLIADRGRLPADEAMPLMRQLGDGFAYVHDEGGILHLDIKPDNVLLDKRGRVRIADFGLSGPPGAAAGSLHHQLKSAGTVIGTPAYIAPELVEGGISLADHRSDIYSLGATFYQMLTGQQPFADPDPIQLMVKRLVQAPPPIEQFAPDVPKDLSKLVMAMLAVRPEDRPQGYEDLNEALSEIAGGLDDDSRIIRRRSSFWQYFRGKDAQAGG